MNVTPHKKMFEAMEAFVASTVGDAPLAVETTTAANNRREARRRAMDFLHDLVRLCMREGVRRYCVERGLPVIEDEIKPDQLAREQRQDGAKQSNVVQMP